nr:MAG TPA: pre-60S ribosomal subunit biogenesis, Nmd3, peptidyl transferase.5A [Bacteriophage sp.]
MRIHNNSHNPFFKDALGMTNQVHFLLVKNMVKEQTIYCPKCNRKVGTYDGKGKIDKVCR